MRVSSRDQINFRCGKQLKMYLLNMDNYSEYLRNLIIQDRIKKSDPAFYEDQIKDLQTKIEELKNCKKECLEANVLNQEEINKILEFHAHQYQQQAMSRSDQQRFNFIERTILKQIQQYGYKGSIEQIDEVLLNWPENGNE